MRHRIAISSFAAMLFAAQLSATIFGSIRGLVHDPQHRPIAGAQITVQAENSDFKLSAISNPLGQFQLTAVPVGRYLVTVTAPGFGTQQRRVRITSESAVDVHIPLSLATVSESVEVTAPPEEVNPQSSTSTTTVQAQQIAQTPGAEAANSMAMITDYVPSAVMVHDQLHIRGGHQVSWLIDGVPVPNTNIASNVGPQFDPKDISELEVQRGGYSAEYGDRTFGVFNVVTKSGFDRKNEAELVTSYGSFNSTNDQISLGSHNQRFAYYASLSGNRSDLGLETPTPEVVHDLGVGLGAFTSLIFNRTPADQLRLVASARGDHYQVPNTPDQQASGIRDVEDERDDFVNFSWVHSTSNTILTASPFYHYNRAHYIGGDSDFPIQPEQDRGSNYAGGVVTFGMLSGRHNAHVGVEGFAQHDNSFFAINDKDLGIFPRERDQLWGGSASAFVEDQYKLTDWFTVNAGLRLNHFSGSISENAADPRLGGALRIPHLGWVLRGFYGRYYQPPPLLTVSGPVLALAGSQGFGFLPLHGERDEQTEFGVAIPLRNWAIEVDHFRTAARNYFDHDALGNSNIFFPLTIDRARIHGWEASLRSPRLGGRAQIHLAYSHQFAEGRGGVTGGLTDFSPPENGDYFSLDHDQRDTLSTGVQVSLPWHVWGSTNVNYGSGFLNGDGPSHLPSHTTLDVALGKDLTEKLTVQVSGLNLTDNRFLLDNANTFGGTHFAYPRQVAVQLKYRFKY